MRAWCGAADGEGSSWREHDLALICPSLGSKFSRGHQLCDRWRIAVTFHQSIGGIRNVVGEGASTDGP